MSELASVTPIGEAKPRMTHRSFADDLKVGDEVLKTISGQRDEYDVGVYTVLVIEPHPEQETRTVTFGYRYVEDSFRGTLRLTLRNQQLVSKL